MSFDTYEESVEGGRPIELYEFVYQGGTLAFTSAGRDVLYAARTYQHTPGLSRSAIEDAGEVMKASLKITAPENFRVSRLFEVYPPSDVVDVVVRRLHEDEPTDARVVWLGRVQSVEWGPAHSLISCESVFSQLRQPGLRRIYSRNCPHLLYGSGCRVSSLAFEEEFVVDALSSGGFVVTSSIAGTFPNGYFAGGKIAFTATAGVVERRGIRAHSGDELTLSHPISSLGLGDTILAYPGCDRTKQTCADKFNNLVNYGGFPYIPVKNPFGQSSVF